MNRMFTKWSGLLVLGFLIACGSAVAQTTRPDLLELCKKGTVEQVGQALAAGADVNAKDTNGKSILEYGRENKNSKVLAELIKAGGQVAAHRSHLGRCPRRNKRRVPLPSTRQAEAAAPVEQPCSKSIVQRGYATFFFSWFSELRRSFCVKEKVDGWRTIRQKDSSSFY